MRMSALSKVEMSAFIDGRGRNGNGANRIALSQQERDRFKSGSGKLLTCGFQPIPDDVSALSEARFQEKSVHERGALARVR